MAKYIELSEAQQEALAQTTEGIKLLDYGTEVPVEVALSFLQSKSVADQQMIARALGYQDNTQKMLSDLKGMIWPKPPQQDASVGGQGAVREGTEAPPQNPDAIPAPPQSLRDLMYAVKAGYLPITIADPALIKDRKLIGWLNRATQWIYVWPSRAVASLQSALRSVGDGNVRTLLAVEMESISEQLKALGEKMPKARKDALEKASTALKWIDAKLALGTKDGDKEALALFDEYMKYAGTKKVHGMHTGVNASAEATRLRGELSAIDTDILRHNNQITAHTDAIKVLNEGWHHALIVGSSPTAPIESLDDLKHRYDTAILDVKEGRAGGRFTMAIAEIEREQNLLIDQAKKINVAETVGTVTVNMNGATSADIEAKINQLKNDPAYVNGAPRNDVGKKWRVTSIPATAEYNNISQLITRLEAKKDGIKNAVELATNNKDTALKPYTDEVHRLETEKATKVSERTRRIAELEREKTRIEWEKTKKTTERAEKDTKYRDRITKLDEIDRARTPEAKERLSKEYDKMMSSPEVWHADDTRRTTLDDKTKTRTERGSDLETRARELDKEKWVFDIEKSAKLMESVEWKVSTLQSEAAELARKLDAEATKTGDVDTYRRKLFEEVNRINGELKKLDDIGRKEVANWEKLPKLELDKLLARSKMGNHIYGVSHGLIKFDENVLNQKFVAGSMRWVYGLVALAGAWALTAQAFQDWKSAAWDATDIAAGFVPWYDLYMALVRGKDLNNRTIEWKDFWARVGFGTLALVPGVWAVARTAGFAAVKAAGKADRAIDVVNTVRAVEQSTQVVGKIGSAVFLGVTVYDITKQAIVHPVETITRTPIKK